MQHKEEGPNAVSRRIPIDSDSVSFHGWKIGYTKSHILKSVCTNEQGQCAQEDANCCELCLYNYALNLPHLPDMVFHKNVLVASHENGARIEFNPMDALKRVRYDREDVVKVACSEEWKESRPKDYTTEKVKPFDWTFTTDYQGSISNIKHEPTDKKIDLMKLMRREQILFYQDLTLFEDELHDHGISSCSVKIRVMPSGFYILLRNFVRVDGVQIKINDTRYHFEPNNDYVLKEFTAKSAKIEQLKHVPPALFTSPQEISDMLSVDKKEHEILLFKSP